ncbi:MAG: N-acetylmuramoyl-L-alanine amidase [Thermodesulfovibrionia bacterium]|nr:N-acetylmuramoyl-L-alanine amidase [Thermodesulfovibrionia bacterium]
MKRTLLLSLLVFLICGPGETAKGVTVKGFRSWSGEKYTRVVIDLDGHVKYSQNRLFGPDRIYLDLYNCFLSKRASPSLVGGDSFLKKLRVSQFNKKTVRVVLDLQEFKTFKVFELNNPSRIVIDVFGKKGFKSVLAEEKRAKLAEIKRVVIDPGHGGEDPGAIGPHGLKEKDVALAIAKKLGRILRKKYNMETILTRERDVYVPLEERTAIANSKKGDLFISIHVNSSRNRKLKGIETYFLNWTTDAESNRVAARENAISYKEMRKVQSELQMILQDLERDNKKDESMKLAGNVQVSMVNTLKRDYKKIVNLGVKHALFYVLVGAEMQSILIETSFISNYEEERRLSNGQYRDSLAESIADGINNYIESERKIVKRTTRDKI